MESFAKLSSGIYYVSENNVTVNMYYPTVVKVDDTVTITQTKDFQSQQEAEFVFSGSKEFTLSLRKPEWANVVEVYHNGQKLDIQAQDGYYNITKAFKDGDKVTIKTPFEYRLVGLKGHSDTYAIMYGPTLYVCDLGTENVQDQQPNQLNFGVGYIGNITDKIVLENNDLASNARVVVDENNQITMYVDTLNQGTLTFRPFNQLFHSRYGMYFKFYESLDELDKDYTVNGNEASASFDKLSDVTNQFDIYGNISKNVKVENGTLVTPADGEVKLISKQALTQEYAVDVTLNSVVANGQINGGVYVLASNPSDAQDGIKAYNVHVEKGAGSNNYTISVFKFNQGFLGSVASTTLPYDGNDISLHIYVQEDKILVFTGTSRNVVLEVMIDKSFITETTTYVGMRSQVCSQTFKEFSLISKEISVGTTQLSSAISMAEGYDLTKVTEETANALRAALENAKAVLNAETLSQKAVNEANEALREAIANLVEIGDPTSLNALLTFAETLDEAMYTQASYASLNTTVEKIKASDLTKLNQAGVDALKAELLAKIEALVAQEVEVVADMTVLNAMISNLESLDTSKYTEESVQALQAALAEAKQLTAQSTQTAIDEACVELLQAQLGLVEKEVEVVANMTVLNAMISNLESLDTSKYTEESVQALQAALAEAKQLTAQSTQTAIDEACVELLQAQLGLVEKEVEVTPTPETPKKGCKGASSFGLISLITILGALTLKRRK